MKPILHEWASEIAQHNYERLKLKAMEALERRPMGSLDTN